MSLTKYSISEYSFFSADDGKPSKYTERVTFHYHKPKGLPKGYNLRASVFGTWWDENTALTLKPDSTFSLVFSKVNNVYATCGTFRFNSNNLVLKDLRDKTKIMLPIDCDALTISPIKERWGNLEYKPLLFDQNNEIHLFYNWLGLWLQENCMILVKMR